MKNRRTLVLPAMLALVFSPCAALASHFSSYEPAPLGLVLVARPTIYWPLFLGAGTSIKDVSLTINGVSQDISYDSSTQMCVSTLDKPLPSGDYVGKITVAFDDGTSYDKTWQFSIASDAVSDFPAPDGDASAAADTVNALRRDCGLPDVRLSAPLCAAAQAHCDYMKQNDAYSHLELADKPGFTGMTPEDRVRAWGYPYGDYEDISVDSTTDKMIQGLVDAPYHREAFLEPGSPDFGYGGGYGKSTLEFGITEDTGVSIYPYDGQTGVPISWTDDEFPDPLRLHPGAGRIAGYPITLFYYGPVGSAIEFVSATLTDGKSDIPIYVNRDANDTELHGGVVVIPQAPLAPDTTYSVHISGSTTDGKDISRVWSFTTASK